ncbi:hypothetical protein MRB53_039166 [Persea americana]|nr:hypothetical protein MRB53_039166 [Persea americana]
MLPTDSIHTIEDDTNAVCRTVRGVQHAKSEHAKTRKRADASAFDWDFEFRCNPAGFYNDYMKYRLRCNRNDNSLITHRSLDPHLDGNDVGQCFKKKGRFD